MSLRLIYGKSGTGKTTFCFNEINKLLKQGEKKIIIITPEQFSFTAEKNLLKAVNSNAVIYAEVLTFERMAYRVMLEIGEANKTNLTECGRAILLYDILDKNKKYLKYLGKTEKNLDLIAGMITELKKHNINEKIMQNASHQIENKQLQYKLDDIELLYSQYNDKIKNDFIDENDNLTILYENIDKTNLFKDAIIYIDEFAGFTKQEYLIIEKLLKICKQINISICIDNLRTNTNPDSDLFYPNKIAVNNLIEMARKNDIIIDKEVYLEKKYRFKSKELNYLEDAFSKNIPKQYKENCEDISLFLSNNLYSEVEYVANSIISLVREQEYRYSDIAIITKEIDTYSGLIKAIFSKYQIPVFIDEKKELNENILVKYVTAVLDIFAKNWSTESIFNYIKTGFLEIDKEDIFLLENYCKNFGIKGLKRYTEEWKITTNPAYNLEKLNKLREKIVNPILKMKQALSKNKTVKEMTEQVYKFLIENNIYQKMNEKSEILKEEGKIDLANTYDTSWNILMKILDEMVLVVGKENISFEKYAALLKVGLNHSSLGKIPATQDEVTVGDIDRSRSSKKKIVFVIGLNDGVFPSVNKNEGLIDDEERILLRKNGMELAKTVTEQIYDENFNIYKAFTTAEEKLFLSYASSNTDGKGLRKSILINKIKKIFPKLKEISDITEPNYLENYISTKDTTFDMLIINLRRYFNGEDINTVWFQIYKLYYNDNDYRKKLQEAIKGFGYTNIPEKINQENLKKLYGETLQTSISKLETYKRCPFSYFIKYGLQLSDKTEFKVENLDTGTLMHDVIDSFFNYINENNINIRELEENELKEIAEQIINSKLQLDKNYIFNSTAKYIFLTNRLKKVIIQSIQYILNTIILSDFNVLGTEIKFDKSSKYPPIEVKLDNNQKIEIIGKIDRVDIAENEDGKYIRIIDYKSSVKNVDLNEVMAGIQIQLLTYLDAVSKQEEASPAGLLYFSLIDPVIKAKNRGLTDEQIEKEIKSSFRMNGLILGDVKVVQMMDNTLTNGKSDIIPAYIDAKGNVSKTRSNSVDALEFKLLQQKINEILKQISKEILSGNISPKPVYLQKKKSTTCLYCKYQSICGFNPEIKGNYYTYVPNLDKNVILDKLKDKM